MWQLRNLAMWSCSTCAAFMRLSTVRARRLHVVQNLELFHSFTATTLGADVCRSRCGHAGPSNRRMCTVVYCQLMTVPDHRVWIFRALLTMHVCCVLPPLGCWLQTTTQAPRNRKRPQGVVSIKDLVPTLTRSDTPHCLRVALFVYPHNLLAYMIVVRGHPEATLRTPQQYQHRMEDYEKGYLGSVPVSWARNLAQSALREYWIRRKGELGYLGDEWEDKLARL